jgi:hypothetical protein
VNGGSGGGVGSPVVGRALVAVDTVRFKERNAWGTGGISGGGGGVGFGFGEGEVTNKPQLPPAPSAPAAAAPQPPPRQPPKQPRPNPRAAATAATAEAAAAAKEEEMAAIDRPMPAWAAASAADTARLYAEVASQLTVPEAVAGRAPVMQTSRGRVAIKGAGRAGINDILAGAPRPGSGSRGGGGGGGGGLAGRRSHSLAAGTGGGGRGGGGAGPPPRPPREAMGLPGGSAPVTRPPPNGGGGFGTAAPSEILRRQEALGAQRRKSPSVQGRWNAKFLDKYNLKKHNLF